MDPATARETTDLIQSRDFNCPKAKLAYAEGVDAYGSVMKVHCGPADREGTYEKSVFRVTGRPDGSWLVAPWN